MVVIGFCYNEDNNENNEVEFMVFIIMVVVEGLIVFYKVYFSVKCYILKDNGFIEIKLGNF